MTRETPGLDRVSVYYDDKDMVRTNKKLCWQNSFSSSLLVVRGGKEERSVPTYLEN